MWRTAPALRKIAQRPCECACSGSASTPKESPNHWRTSIGVSRTWARSTSSSIATDCERPSCPGFSAGHFGSNSAAAAASRRPREPGGDAPSHLAGKLGALGVNDHRAPAGTRDRCSLDPCLLEALAQLGVRLDAVAVEQQGAAQGRGGRQLGVERAQRLDRLGAEHEATGLQPAIGEVGSGALAGPPSRLQPGERLSFADEGAAADRRPPERDLVDPRPPGQASRASRPPSPSPIAARRGASVVSRSHSTARLTAATQDSNRPGSAGVPALSPVAGRSKRSVGCPLAASRSAQRRRLR